MGPYTLPVPRRVRRKLRQNAFRRGSRVIGTLYGTTHALLQGWLAEPDPTHYTRHRLLATPKLGVHVTAPARSAACAALLGSCAAAGQAVARQAVSRYRGWTVATRVRGLRGSRCQSRPAVMEESASQEVLRGATGQCSAGPALEEAYEQGTGR